MCKVHPGPHCAEREHGPGTDTSHDEQRTDAAGGGGLASLWDNATKAGSGVAEFFKGVGDALKTAGLAVWWVLKQVVGLVWGVLEGLGDALQGLAEALAHPIQTVHGIIQLVTNADEAWPALWHELTAPVVQAWKNGDYGYAIGRAIGTVVAAVVGGKGITKLGKLSKSGKAGKAGKKEPGDKKPSLDKAELDRRHSLGEDPATGRYRPDEERAAVEIERRLGIKLERNPAPEGPDWRDPETGKTYDAVGSNLREEHFDQQWQSARVQWQVHRHLNKKKADYVPIDVTNLNRSQRAQVEAWVRQQDNNRIFIIGEGG